MPKNKENPSHQLPYRMGIIPQKNIGTWIADRMPRFGDSKLVWRSIDAATGTTYVVFYGRPRTRLQRDFKDSHTLAAISHSVCESDLNNVLLQGHNAFRHMLRDAGLCRKDVAWYFGYACKHNVFELAKARALQYYGIDKEETGPDTPLGPCPVPGKQSAEYTAKMVRRARYGLQRGMFSAQSSPAPFRRSR